MPPTVGKSSRKGKEKDRKGSSDKGSGHGRSVQISVKKEI